MGIKTKAQEECRTASVANFVFAHPQMSFATENVVVVVIVV